MQAALQPATMSYVEDVANHLNDNLKMLLYLVDADKLKKVQNILFGKHSRISRKTHMSKHHCHHMNHHKSKRFHKGILGALPPHGFAPAPRMQHTHATEPVSGMPSLAVFIPSYQQHIKHLEKSKRKKS